MNPAAPGYRTTEFWLTLGIHLLTVLIASGVLPADSVWEKVAALVLSALSQMSYNSSRGQVKSAQADASAAAALSEMPLGKPGVNSILLLLSTSLLLGLAGCSVLQHAQPPQAAYVAADHATYDAVAPEYQAYFHDDPMLSPEQKDRRDRTVRTWHLRIERGEAAIKAAPQQPPTTQQSPD